MPQNTLKSWKEPSVSFCVFSGSNSTASSYNYKKCNLLPLNFEKQSHKLYFLYKKYDAKKNSVGVIHTPKATGIPPCSAKDLPVEYKI